MMDDIHTLLSKHFSRELVDATRAIMEAIQRAVPTTTVQLDQWSQAHMDAANTYKPFRRERERYLRHRRQTRATFHGK